MLYLNDKDRWFLSIITFHRANDGLSAYHDPVNKRVLFLLPLTDFCLCLQYAFPCILFSLLSIAYDKLIFCCLRRIIGETFKIMCFWICIQSSLKCQFLSIFKNKTSTLLVGKMPTQEHICKEKDWYILYLNEYKPRHMTQKTAAFQSAKILERMFQIRNTEAQRES